MGRKRTYIRIDAKKSFSYLLCKYTKILPTTAVNIVWPDEDNHKYKILRHKKKLHQEDSSSPHANASMEYLLGNELKDLLKSVKDSNLKKGIEIGIKKSINRMHGYISSSELVEERFRFDNPQDAPQKTHSALNIFIKCIEKGYYPPEEILKFVADKFKVFMSGDNKLDAVFGVNKSSKKAYFKRVKDMNIVIEVDFLRHHFGISTEDAIDAVCESYKEKGIHYGYSTYEDIYYRDGKDELDNSSMEQHKLIYEIEDFDNDDEKKDFLEDILIQYPERVINKLKIKYPLMKPLLSSPIEKLESIDPVN